MFIKKRPNDLPKAPKLDENSNFSLFGGAKGDVAKAMFESVRGNKAASSPAASRRTVPDDVVDVEVIDIEARQVEPAAAGEADYRPPLPEDIEDARPVNSVGDEPADEPVSPPAPASSVSSGLKFRRKSVAETAPPAPEMSEQPLHSEAPKTSGLRFKHKEAPDSASEQQLHDERASGDVKAASPTTSFFSRFKSAKSSKDEAQASEKNKFSEQGTAPPSSTQSKATGSRLFGAAFKTAAKSAAASESVEKPAAKPLFSFGSKSSKTKKTDTTKAAKVKASKQKFAKGSNHAFLMAELEGGKRVYWRLTADDIVEVAPEEAGPAASFGKGEYRYFCEEPLKYGLAQDLALAEVGEDVRIVNESKLLKAVYASTVSRVNEILPNRVGPGIALVDHLLRSERAEGEELLAAVELYRADGAVGLVVLLHYNDKNEVADLQVTVNPESITFVLSQFAASRRLDVDGTKVVFFKNSELLSVWQNLEVYPDDAVWQGIPIRRILNTAAVGSLAVAGLVGAFAGQAYVGNRLAAATVTQLHAQHAELKKQMADKLESSVGSFAAAQSLQLDEITQRAGLLWAPGAKVTVDAMANTQTYTVSLPLIRGGMAGARPSVLLPVTPAHVAPLLNEPAPEGCTKNVPELSGGVNVVQVTVKCESPAGPLSAYRID